MFIYDGKIVKQANGLYMAVILKVHHDDPNYDTVMEHETYDYEEAMIWVDDELSRLRCGKGVWERL